MKAILPILVLVLVLYALLDCARTPEEQMPARIPKALWIILIILSTFIGSIAWIIVSRVKAAEERGGYVEPTVWSSSEGTTFRRPQRRHASAPDDDPEFLRSLGDDVRRRRRQTPNGPASTGQAPDGESPTTAPDDDAPEPPGSNA